jgi:hypothetical protein
MFSPIATLLVGLALAFIAWQQMQIARNKLRLDLFDRRYRVYDATRNFVAAILRDTTFQDAQLRDFYVGTSDAEFLFGSDILNYLTHVKTRANTMRVQRTIYERMPVGEERLVETQKEHEHFKWFTDQPTNITIVFSPYLGFSHIK